MKYNIPADEECSINYARNDILDLHIPCCEHQQIQAIFLKTNGRASLGSLSI